MTGSNTITGVSEVPQTLAPGVSPDWEKLTFGLQDTAPVRAPVPLRPVNRYVPPA